MRKMHNDISLPLVLVLLLSGIFVFFFLLFHFSDF